MRRFKDARKEFERSSESLEGALARNAQAPRGKPHEAEEAGGALLNARRAFRSGALDYVLEVSRQASGLPPLGIGLAAAALASSLLRSLSLFVADQHHRGQEEDGTADGRE